MAARRVSESEIIKQSRLTAIIPSFTSGMFFIIIVFSINNIVIIFARLDFSRQAYQFFAMSIFTPVNPVKAPAFDSAEAG